MRTLVIDGPTTRCRSTLRLPGDKSIAHRALIFAAVAEGTSRIRGLPGGGDVRATRVALQALGVRIRPAPGGLDVTGRGFAGLDRDDEDPVTLDCRNSGTTARLLVGLLAGRRGVYRLVGDASLSRRPMTRVVEPLRAFGATIEGGECLPLTVRGGDLIAPGSPIVTTSAQVLSALLLAGLQAKRATRVEARGPLRDHGERAARAAGVPLDVEAGAPGTSRLVTVRGPVAALSPVSQRLPGDLSSAAFFAALAAATPGARVRFEGVSVNATRLGFFRLLERMGAAVRVAGRGEGGDGGAEEQGTIEVRHRSLRGVTLSHEEAAGAIDELPLVALVGTLARGRTSIRGAGELRVKESDRIARTVEILTSFGARVTARADGIEAAGGDGLRAADVEAGDDHRIAMLAAVAASLATGRSVIRGAEAADVSFPGFASTLEATGARVAAT